MYNKLGGRRGARPLQRRGRRPTPTYGRSFHSPRQASTPSSSRAATIARGAGLDKIMTGLPPMEDNPYAKAAMTKTIIDPETGEEIEVDLEQAEEALRQETGLGSLLRAKGGPAKKKKKKSRKKPRGIGKALRGYGKAMK
tara:strand:- start:361 stop:780 length:420 start_codon:yes stop_codon:yes gene_type:complete